MEVDDAVWDAFKSFRERDDGRQAVEGRQACPYCKKYDEDLVTLDGNVICRQCNTVCDRLLDYGAEWRYYGAEDSRGTDPTRCCPPSNELIPTLGCMIGGGSTAVAMTIQKYHVWNSITHRERTLFGVFDVLYVNATQHGISPCILEEAKTLYKRISDAKISRGENRVALIACSMYLACKSNKVPRSIKEIAAMFNIRVNAMTKGCRIFQQMIKMDLDSSSPADFVRRFCSRLNIGQAGAALAKHIVERVDALEIIPDSTPPSIVAGAIQMINVELKLKLDKATMAEACMVSPVTITKCYKRLELYRGMLLPEDLDAFIKASEPPPIPTAFTMSV